jgi:hypothetical protein
MPFKFKTEKIIDLSFYKFNILPNALKLEERIKILSQVQMTLNFYLESDKNRLRAKI